MRVVLIALLTLFSCQSFSQVQEFALDNGLKILVKEDHRAPVAVSMVWYNVGSADEPGGITGISHALEHVMFKGTSKYPVGVFSRTIAALGAQENAFTSNDYTAFFEKLDASRLAVSFELEADRMQNLLFDKTEFDHEMQVIQEERRLRTDDNPQALAFERFLATAHLADPYHHPVIGWMSDIRNIQVSDAKAWYNQYYAPNNATLVVVGDVNGQAVYDLAKKYFGSLQPRSQPTRKPQFEPPFYGKKSVQIHTAAQMPIIMLGYTVPSATAIKTAKNPDEAIEPYALEILAGILSASDSARFNKNLIRGSHIASSVDTSYNLYQRYQTQFMIYGTPSQTHTVEALKNAIIMELKRLQNTPVDAAELQRVKTQLIAQKTFEKDSIFGQATELGLLETLGLGWKMTEAYADRINSVTAEQIQKTAQRYFNDNALTEAELIPNAAH